MKRKLLCAALIVACLAFIWGHSAVPATASHAESSRLLRLLRFLPQNEFGENLVRKLAHFAEFAALGLLSGWMGAEVRKRISPLICGFGLFCACVDEAIQAFTPGRNAALADVALDSAGFAFGLALAALGYTILKHHFGGKQL